MTGRVCRAPDRLYTNDSKMSGQEVLSGNAVRVQLVNKPASPHTGIGRYAAELERGLRGAGANLRIARLTNPLPRSAVSLGRRVGYDLETFFHSYPIRADIRPGYVTHLTSQTLGILLLAQRLPRPVVVTVHDILPYLLRHDPDLNVYRNQAQRLLDALTMRGLARADRLVADSHYTKSTLVNALGIAPAKIDVVHLGVDSGHFKPRPVPEEFRRRYRLPADRPYVLYVGSEDPRKNLPLLLEAFALAHRENPELILVKVGAAAFSEQRERHLRLCTELGIQDVVQWCDQVVEEELPLFYNGASVFAFPSRFEGFGFPVLEALACGTPVVACGASSVVELARDAALLVEGDCPSRFATALSQAVSLKWDRARLVEPAKSFRWEKTLEGTLQAYQRANTPLPADSHQPAGSQVAGGMERNR